MSDLSGALKNQDRDTVIFGILIISVFTAMIFGVAPAKATVAGCLFLALYVIARFLLMLVKVRELQLLFRKDIDAEAAKLIESHATQGEKEALTQIKPLPRRRGKAKATTGDDHG